jgi:hypothetical protein
MDIHLPIQSAVSLQSQSLEIRSFKAKSSSTLKGTQELKGFLAGFSPL